MASRRSSKASRDAIPSGRRPRPTPLTRKPPTALIKADEYQITGRWQQLQLRQPMKRLREQLQLMRADQRRDVIGEGAYIDRLVLNVWSGKGMTQVWIDDMEVSPVEETKR